jgi:hypothetical protein
MAVTPKLNFTRVSISDALSAENTRSGNGARIFLAEKNHILASVSSVADLARLSNRDKIAM